MKRIIVVLMLMVPLMGMAQDIAKLRAKSENGDTKAMIELAMCYECGHGVAVDSAQACSLYQRAVEKGAADAKAQMARYYLDYSGLTHDTVKAIKLLRESVSAGSADGMCRLAWCYAQGVGVERDVAKSKELYNQALATGSSTAYNVVGNNYYWGNNGYNHDVEKGAKLLLKAKDGLSASNKYVTLAQYYYLRGEYKKIWQWIDKGVALDNFSAQVIRAFYTYIGVGKEADPKQACEQFEALMKKYKGEGWINRMYALTLTSGDEASFDTAKVLQLVLQGGSSCYDLLSSSYYFGTFTEVDSAMRLHYLYKGLKEKDGDMITELALWHFQNENMDSTNYYLNMAYDLFSSKAAQLKGSIAEENEDMELAARCYEQAGDWGDESNRVTAGRIYGMLGHMDKAFECFNTAAANYEPTAWYWLGYLESFQNKNYHKTLEKGIKHGCTDCAVALGDELRDQEEPDYVKAATYYRQGGDEGNVREALLYLRGQVGERSPDDYRAALNLLLKAAHNGYADGMYNAAYCYQMEVAGEENRDSMYYWYKRLADLDDGRGMLGVGTCYESGIGVLADTMKALQWYQRAGDNGVSNGYAYCADLYVHGTGVPQDYAKAFEYDQKAVLCSDDNAKSLLRLAECYMTGIGTTIDTTAAIPLIRESAQKGSYRANALLGDAFYYGWPGTRQNTDSAMLYYYQASQGDDPRGDYMIGCLLLDQEMYGPAIQYLRSAASNGSVDAYEKFAECLLNGYGLDPDPERAYTMFKEAAEEYDNAAAYTMLGIMHYMGKGCQYDTVKAYQYTMKAAQMGDIRGMRNAAIFVGNGIGCEADTVEGIHWYERAADRGDVRSMLVMAQSYVDGEWVEQSMEQAVKWYQRAADKGNTEAMWRLGVCYEEGEGVILNHRKAFEYYQRAAEAGSPTGMYLVGHCYEDAIFVEASMNEAINWYLQAADNGHISSCYLMGLRYATGDGVKKNKKEARRLLTIAAENGMDAAVKALEDL
ncbi:MAG: sel1 repeat family protein [Prevotella sp.]|nr:sel1 repeat family protein [Prevotella sp.]